MMVILQWRHNRHECISNHQLSDCLLNRLFRRRSKKISKLRDTGLCAGNSPVTGEFPAQIASNNLKVDEIWIITAIHEVYVLWVKQNYSNVTWDTNPGCRYNWDIKPKSAITYLFYASSKRNVTCVTLLIPFALNHSSRDIHQHLSTVAKANTIWLETV